MEEKGRGNVTVADEPGYREAGSRHSAWPQPSLLGCPRAWQDSSKAAPIRCSLDPWKNSQILTPTKLEGHFAQMLPPVLAPLCRFVQPTFYHQNSPGEGWHSSLSLFITYARLLNSSPRVSQDLFCLLLHEQHRKDCSPTGQ